MRELGNSPRGVSEGGAQPRSGDSLAGTDAWRHAAREADRYEAMAPSPSD
jgi:hypothetical protein